MAEALKGRFGPEMAAAVADMIGGVLPSFDREGFLAEVLDGFERLELTPRARRIAEGLHSRLPPDSALEVIIAALGPEIEEADLRGMEVFVYLPFVFYVAEHGLDRYETAMAAQYELTKRFTAEFSIRAFIERHPAETLARLREWAVDPNPHVRRLVSEGTRPRLPWAPRLRDFILDPAPVLELLELLKDDPELYVRRSVANNLNDIAKDHPDLVVDVCRRWSGDAGPERGWLIRHALRTLVKQGNQGALEVLGFGRGSPVRTSIVLSVPVVQIGGRQAVTFVAENPTGGVEAVAIDFRVHFVKARGDASPKVFKGAELVLAPGESASFVRRISLAQQSTRTHHPGVHVVDVLVNGEIREGSSFLVE